MTSKCHRLFIHIAFFTYTCGIFGFSLMVLSSLLQGKNPEDVVRRYTEKIKVLPDEVRRRRENVCSHSWFRKLLAHQEMPCDTIWCPNRIWTSPKNTLMEDGRWNICVGYSRTVPSAWRGWSCHRAMKASCSTKASSQSWWANLANVGICTICCAWWPCTTMAIRWVKACEPDVVMMSL